jgi:integrase
MGAYRDQHGTWRYRKRIQLLDGSYVRVKGSPALNTKAAAEAAERAHIERAIRGALEPAKPKEVITLKKFIEEVWWPKFVIGGGKRGKNEESSLKQKDVNIRIHLMPALGHLRLDQVTNERVMAFFGKLRLEGYSKRGRRARSNTPAAARKRKQRALGRGIEEQERRQQAKKRGLSEKSVQHIRATLRTILSYAVRWGHLQFLPELPEVVVPEAPFDWYQPQEAVRLVAGARDAWERALLLFPLHTGTRLGEQRAIRWTDVDFELARVYVRRSAPSGFDTIKAPKSNRQRWVDLTPELGAALQAIRHSAELIFCEDDGSLLRPGQFQEVLWAAQRRAGLRRIKWHDLRHSYASILASGGMPLFLIRGLLGHSSISMTERYAHLAASQTAAYMPLLAAAAPSGVGLASRKAGPLPDPLPQAGEGEEREEGAPPAASAGPQAGPSTLASPN